MASGDSRKRSDPRQQSSILNFFRSATNKRKCTKSVTADSGNIEPDVTMANADNQGNAIESACEVLPLSKSLTAEGEHTTSGYN